MLCSYSSGRSPVVLVATVAASFAAACSGAAASGTHETPTAESDAASARAAPVGEEGGRLDASLAPLDAGGGELDAKRAVDAGAPDRAGDASTTDALDGGAAQGVARCGAIDASASIIEVGVSEAGPPSFEGGAIAAGTYAASAITVYGSPLVEDGGPGNFCLGFEMASYAWAFAPDSTGAAGAFSELSVHPAQEYLFPQFSGQYSTSGATLTYTPTCATCCSGSTLDVAQACSGPSSCQTSAPDGRSHAVSYAASGSRLLLGVDDTAAGCGVLVLVLDRQ